MTYTLMILHNPTNIEVIADYDEENNFTTYYLSATLRGANVEAEIEIDNHDPAEDDLSFKLIINAITEAYIDHLESEIAKRDERIIEAQLKAEGSLR